MWERLRNNPKDGGAPLNRKKLEAWQNSRSSSSTAHGVKGGDGQYQYSIKGGPAPPRPPREPNNNHYPSERYHNRQSLQPAQPAQARSSYRNSGYARPVSSIYSQPSPDAATFATRQLRVEVPHNDPNEISPPSSPDILSPRDEPNSGDVSPIEEVPDMSQLAIESRGPAKPEPRTNIPMMRRERRKNSDAALNALRESKSRERLKQQRPYGHDVRWDPSTGEPTTDVKGRPSQVNPQEYAQGLGIREGSVSPPQTKRDQPDQNPFGERIRVRRPSGNPQPESSMGQRPEWRGASGRTTLVAPVNDTKNVPPLKLPRKSSKRAGREPNTLSPDSSAGSGFAPSLVAQSSGFEDNRGAPMQPTRLQSLNVAATDPNINNPQTYPSPPLSDNTAPTNSFAPSELPNQPHKSLQVPLNDRAIRRKPAGGTGHHPQQSTSSSIYSQQDVVQPKRAALTASLDGWTQPPSRFSVTTYATSQQSTPRGSLDEDRPPVPTPPQQFMQGNAISILDRKRPVVAGFEGGSRKGTPIEPVKISLDSPYYMTPAVSSKAPQAQQSSLSLATREKADTDKSLPPVPPETQSQDRVTQLDARLRVLGNRRINLNTAIRQMTELMPTDNILASEEVVRKRDEEKRKVEGLRRELADVERESYELGLKLHRAYKRLDRDAEFEPTTLWVRRVTG